MADKINKSICVVGAGYWGKNHIRTLNRLNVLKGIVEHDNDTLNTFIKKYPEVNGHLKIEDALNEDYDGFIIATPAKTHFEIGKTIINAGKHVLIEKPLTLSIKEAKELVALADKNKINAMVGHVLLFHPAIKKIKKMIDNGEIGNLQYIYSNRLNLGKVRTEENVFWSFAPHDIAIFQYLTDSIPMKINANGSTFLQEGIPDSTMTQLEYENGVKGHIFVSWLHPYKEHKFIIIGSKGMISFEDSHKEKPLIYHNKRIDWVNGDTIPLSGEAKLINYDKDLALDNQLKYLQVLHRFLRKETPMLVDQFDYLHFFLI